MRGPGRGRRQFQRLFRDHHGRDRVIGTLRLDEQAAQTEQAGVLALGHGVEGGARAGAVALELRRLRMQQQGQGIVAREPPRGIGVLAGCGRIAMADREQSLCNGMAAAGVAALMPAPAHASRRAPQPCKDPPDQHGRDHDNADREHEHRQRGCELVDAPRQHDFTGLLGNPRRAGRRERDQAQEQDDPDHTNPIVPPLRATPSHHRRIDARPTMRHRARPPCRARPAPAHGRRATDRRDRGGLPRNRCAMPPR